MLIRFMTILVLLTSVATSKIAIERHNLSLKRSISRQHAELYRLEETRATAFSKAQQQAALRNLTRSASSTTLPEVKTWEHQPTPALQESRATDTRGLRE